MLDISRTESGGAGLKLKINGGGGNMLAMLDFSYRSVHCSALISLAAVTKAKRNTL